MSQMVRSAMLAVLLLGSCLAGQACARAQTRTPAELPPLEVPVAPPRVIAPAETPLPAAPAELPPGPATPPQPARPPARPPQAPRSDAPARTEPAPQTPGPAREERPAEPALQIRTPQSGSNVEAERQIRDLIQRAGDALSRVNYAALNADAKTHYDTAKRFMEQAAEAVKVKNFVFAKYLADKADTLARELSGR